MAENHLHEGSAAGLPPSADFDELASGSVVEDAPPSPNGSSNAGGGGTGGGSNSGKKLARPIIRSAQACSQCRSHKIRCVPGPDPEVPFPCSRCIAQNLTCEVLKHNRGRKRKQPPTEAERDLEKRSSSSSQYANQKVASANGAASAPLSAALASSASRSQVPGPAGSSTGFHSSDNGNLHMLEQAIAMSGGVPGGHPQAGTGSSGTNGFPSPRVAGLQPVFMRSPRANDGSQQHQKQPSIHGHIPAHQPSQFPNAYQISTQHQDYRPGSNIFSNILNQPSGPGQTSHYAGGSSMSSASFPPPQHMPQILPGYGMVPPSVQTGQADGMAPIALTHPQVSQARGSPSQNRLSPSHPSVPTPTKEGEIRLSGKAAEAGASKLEKLKFPFLIPRSGRTGRRGMFSLANLLPPEQVEEVGPSPAMANWSEQTLLANDPVQIGILTMEDAKTLFQLYMDEMSTVNALLDPTVHTHDFVRDRSKFLYCAILSVISRYLNATTFAADGTQKRLLSPVYVYCKKAASAHLRAVLGNIETSLEVIQGLTILTFHKDPEDEKACLNLYRAIAIAREIGLDQVRASPDMSDDEKLWTRIKQRVWLSLFVANTILTMQFDMNVLIGPDDPAVSASSRFAIGSPLPTDTLLCASVQFRRLYHIYSDMAKSLETIGETQADKATKLISLSLLTRTANRELEQALRDWREACTAAGLVRIDSKLGIWVAAIKLKLNLTIVQMSLPGLRERATIISGSFLPPKKEPATDGPRGRSVELGCINAFHHSIAAACQILQSMPAMAEKKLLSFAADTFLSFSIYAAFFLWTLCRDTGPTLLQEAEIDHCYGLIEGAARALESASLYPGDSPGLHGRFLRSLIVARSQHKKHNGAVVAEPMGWEDGGTDNNHGSDPPQGSDYVHPTLDALSRLQPSGANPPPPPSVPQGNADPAQAPALAADIDMMLMADWNAMQKDFPWAFNENGIPFLDGNTEYAQAGVQPQSQLVPPAQPAYTQLIPESHDYDMSFLPRNGGTAASQGPRSSL